MKEAKLLPTRTIPIKVDVKIWQTLKQMKKENETFNDVIKGFLELRTKSRGDANLQAIRYKRLTALFTLAYGEVIGVEFEYNDVKGQRTDFTMDISIKKIFFRKKSYNPSEFFGVDNAHKHYSEFFLEVYLNAVSQALMKEFRIFPPVNHRELIYWKQAYNDYNLSEDSFKEDIEEPLRLSKDEKPQKQWIERINESIASMFIKEKGIVFT